MVMVLPGETKNSRKDSIVICEECGCEMPLKVLKSGAGYYLGHFCDYCGPYSRESGYFPTENEAQEALDNDNFENRKVGYFFNGT